MNLARFAIEKRVISALATLLILLGGYFAYTALPRFEDPEFIIRQAPDRHSISRRERGGSGGGSL